MAIRTFMVLIDNDGKQIVGESPVEVFDPYTKTKIAAPTELLDWSLGSEEPLSIGDASTGAGNGKIVFNGLSTSRRVDRLTQILFVNEGSGVTYKFLDLMVVNDGSQPTNGGTSGTLGLRPHLSYRFGLVGVTKIDTIPADDAVREDVVFLFGSWLIGYQLLKPDGTLSSFLPTGWDRVTNMKL